MYWICENYVTDALNVKNYVGDLMNVRKLCNRWTDCGKIQ